MIKYSELHCHSSFSLLNGASNPEDLVARAKELGLSALALTDHNDMGGAVRFYQEGKELDFHTIYGNEVTFYDDSHLILLAKDLSGYKNICSLISLARAQNERGEPRISYEQLAEHKAGLIALSGCPKGIIPASLACEDKVAAYKYAGQLREIFGEDFFLELWSHQLRQEEKLCREMLEMSKKLWIPWVVTNNVHYVHPEQRIIHDVLTCVRHQTTLAQAGRKLRPNGNWYMKSPEEMAYYWRENLEGIRNTQVITERCTFKLDDIKQMLKKFPFFNEGSAHNNKTLEDLVWLGAKDRYTEITTQHKNQIKHELELIAKLDVASFFLIMKDVIDYAAAQGITVQGRGSAANSVVCYCLKITAVDPIKMDLLFERFLSEERDEPPDIDLDIAHQERERVLQYIYQKYGHTHAAMVCNVNCYRGKSALRDAARVLGFSQEKIDTLAKRAHFGEAKDAAHALANGGLQESGLDPKDRRSRLLIKIMEGLNNLPRHRSIHVGGFVLTQDPIGSIVPVEPAQMDNRTVIQWDKDDTNLIGMIKIDFLGLGMLTMIQNAIKLIRNHYGKEIDLGKLDMHDQNIYQMLAKADTVGLFQVESRAQMSILPKLKPSCFYDIVVSVAIVRPGPIQGNIVHPYVRRRNGLEEVTYVHPIVEPILKRTLGVPLFQEQGMRLAIVAAGLTPKEADWLRIVMSHKRSLSKMAMLCEKLANGMRKNGFSEEAIETITFQLQAFAHYGFPESHAASFALITYASAFLKRYYPAAFFCAIMNAQPMGFYSPDVLMRDAKRHGVRVLSPDLSKSVWDCTLDDDLTLQIGLRYVQGLGSRAQSALEFAWETGGPFKSIEDVVQRSGLPPKALRILAEAGTFDSFLPKSESIDRRQALWTVLALLKEKNTNSFIKRPTDNMIPMTGFEKVVADYKTLNLTTGNHPMVFCRDWANRKGILSCKQLLEAEPDTIIKVAGAVICRQKPSTAKGFVFITIEDESGMANIIVKPSVFKKSRVEIMTASFLVVQGKLQLEKTVLNVIANKVTVISPGLVMPSHDFY